MNISISQVDNRNICFQISLKVNIENPYFNGLYKNINTLLKLPLFRFVAVVDCDFLALLQSDITPGWLLLYTTDNADKSV